MIWAAKVGLWALTFAVHSYQATACQLEVKQPVLEVKFCSHFVLQRQHACYDMKLPSCKFLQFTMVNSCTGEVKEPSILASSSGITVQEVNNLY